MKLLTVLLGVCFIFSVSQKSFACPCQDGKKAEAATATTKVADAKDATKVATPATDSKEVHSCDQGQACAGGKECSCAKGKDGKHMHKDGKGCGCHDKKMES